eukprot:jgi/Picre1/30691/NNA_006052.t1
MKGVSDEVVEMADGICEIDIDGFVDSYNISVAAALMLGGKEGSIGQLGYHGNLTEKEIEILRAVFYLRNKGVFQQYASILLRQKPPEWQVHRVNGQTLMKSECCVTILLVIWSLFLDLLQ